jgi:hypothetical protein
LFQKWFPLDGAESHERKKHAEQPQEDKRKDNMKERFIKNKRLMNPTHISLKKDKHPKTRTTKIVVLMSQSDDEEERKTLQKKQKRQEDTAMKGSIDLQQAIELLMKQ